MSEGVSLWGFRWVPEISQISEMVRKLQEKNFPKHIWGRSCLGGSFKHFWFHPHLGIWSNLTNIFQMGGNHQPVEFNEFIQLMASTLVFYCNILWWDTWELGSDVVTVCDNVRYIPVVKCDFDFLVVLCTWYRSLAYKYMLHMYMYIFTFIYIYRFTCAYRGSPKPVAVGKLSISIFV